MTSIKIESVVSVSSEDNDNRASNLLRSDSDKKWLCSTIGESSINAVFQLESPSKIISVEIQNANSAFVEMLVGRSADADTFKPFLLTSMLMSLKDAKSGENANETKIFKDEVFADATRSEKWDRVKFVCSQPYNKNSKFGLSRVVLHTNGGQDENLNFGKFQMKAENRDAPILQAGGLFARRNQTSTVPENKTVKTPNKKVITVKPSNDVSPTKNPGSIDDILTSDDSDHDPHYVPSKDSDDEFKKGTKDQPKSPRVKRKKELKPSVKIPQKKPNGLKLPQKPQKPFNKFMENVVFVISGFQNPLRGEIRSKAISMGAKYKPDWDPSCTHLVCAFSNTPKYFQVRGKGKIVKKEWIEESYDKKIFFPWRRYALDPNEISKPESDSEVYEERDLPLSVDNRKTVNEDSADTEEEIERVRKNVAKKAEKAEPLPGPSKAQSIYDMDTEEDDFMDFVNNPDSIPDLFDSSVFLILDDLDLEERKMLRRYIIAHKGIVAVDEEDLCRVDYVISESPERVEMVKKEFENVTGVYPEWIYRCHDEKILLPLSKYEVKSEKK